MQWSVDSWRSGSAEVISLTFDLEVKGHMNQGQRAHGSRSNKGPKQRQVDTRQRQVALLMTVKDTMKSRGIRRWQLWPE